MTTIYHYFCLKFIKLCSKTHQISQFKFFFRGSTPSNPHSKRVAELVQAQKIGAPLANPAYAPAYVVDISTILMSSKKSFYVLLYCIVLYCIVLYCIVLYCIVLYCIVLYCIVLHCIAMRHCNALQCTALHCTALYCTALHCTVHVLYCTVLYCTVLYCIVLYCIVLYCIMRPNNEGRLDRYRIGIPRELSEVRTLSWLSEESLTCDLFHHKGPIFYLRADAIPSPVSLLPCHEWHARVLPVSLEPLTFRSLESASHLLCS